MFSRVGVWKAVHLKATTGCRGGSFRPSSPTFHSSSPAVVGVHRRRRSSPILFPWFPALALHCSAWPVSGPFEIDDCVYVQRIFKGFRGECHIRRVGFPFFSPPPHSSVALVLLECPLSPGGAKEVRPRPGSCADPSGTPDQGPARESGHSLLHRWLGLELAPVNAFGIHKRNAPSRRRIGGRR